MKPKCPKCGWRRSVVHCTKCRIRDAMEEKR